MRKHQQLHILELYKQRRCQLLAIVGCRHQGIVIYQYAHFFAVALYKCGTHTHIYNRHYQVGRYGNGYFLYAYIAKEVYRHGDYTHKANRCFLAHQRKKEHNGRKSQVFILIGIYILKAQQHSKPRQQ